MADALPGTWEAFAGRDGRKEQNSAMGPTLSSLLLHPHTMFLSPFLPSPQTEHASTYNVTVVEDHASNVHLELLSW